MILCAPSQWRSARESSPTDMPVSGISSLTSSCLSAVTSFEAAKERAATGRRMASIRSITSAATTWPLTPFWARTGGAEKGSMTSDRSRLALQAMAPTATTTASPTRAVITCSSAFIRSENRPQRRRESTSSRCSCRCSVCSSVSTVWRSRKASSLGSGLGPAF